MEPINNPTCSVFVSVVGRTNRADRQDENKTQTETPQGKKRTIQNWKICCRKVSRKLHLTFSFTKIDVSCASERHPGKHLAKKTDEQDLGFPLFVSLHFRSNPDSSPGPPQISRLSPSNSFYGRATRYSVTDHFWDPRDPSPMSHFSNDLHDPKTRKHLAPAPLPPPYCKQHAKKSGHHAARPGDPAAPVFSIAFGRWTSTAVKKNNSATLQVASVAILHGAIAVRVLRLSVSISSCPPAQQATWTRSLSPVVWEEGGRGSEGGVGRRRAVSDTCLLGDKWLHETVWRARNSECSRADCKNLSNVRACVTKSEACPISSYPRRRRADTGRQRIGAVCSPIVAQTRQERVTMETSRTLRRRKR